MTLKLFIFNIMVVTVAWCATVKKPPKLATQGPAVSDIRQFEGANRLTDRTTTEASSENKNSGDDSHALNKLLDTIFSNYHKELVPVRPTAIKLDLLLLKVKSTIEKEGIFESVIALFMEWTDKRMRWNPREYDNVSILAFDSDKVWLPDIAMTNSADHLYSISKDTRFVVRVSSNGAMKFVPTGTARTWCDLHLLTFPFDIQTCSFEFESWSLDSSTMTFNDSSEALVDDSFSSPQWELCQRHAIVYQHFYNFTGEIFTRVRFDFVVRRKSTFYIINLIFPCATLSMIQLLVFIIPSTDSTSDRVGFGTTNLLTLVVFQTIVTAEMPKSSDAVTALSKYIIALIIISAVGIFESVIAERLLRTTTSPPPKWATRFAAIFPLLWGSQLPSGINQMILEGSDCSNESKKKKDENNAPRDKGCLCFQKQLPPPNRSKNSRFQEEEEDDVWVPQRNSIPRSPSGAVGKARRNRRNNGVRFTSPKNARYCHQNGTSPANAPNLAARLYHRRVSTRKDDDRFQTGTNGSNCLNWPSSNRRYGSHPSDVDDYIMATLRAFNIESSTTADCSTNKTLLASSKSDYMGFSSNALTIYNRSSLDNTSLASSHDETVNKPPPKSSTMTAAGVDNESDRKIQEQLLRIQNGILWGEIVTKVDHFIFISCTVLAIFIPLILFVPLIVFDDKCRTPL